MAIEVNSTPNSDEALQPASATPISEPQPEPISSAAAPGFQQEPLGSSVNGLSQQELNDPNKITVTVPDDETPIVVLFGPPSCGKTMTLVRMTRFLLSEGYTVEPVRTFRSTADTHYARMCDEFDEMINSNDAASSTSRISFMLVQVLDKHGRAICQILEAPGEYYFDGLPTTPFPVYVNSIIGSNNRKLWAIFVEPDWNDAGIRANYVTKITRLKSMMSRQDKTLFVYNKIDRTRLVISQGEVNVKEAIRQVEKLYPRIFTPFLNLHPVTKLWKTYNCDFVPFQTGYYNESMSGVTYTESNDAYPRIFWKALLKQIRG